MKTLKLFNAVLAKASNQKEYISEMGLVIAPEALWARREIEAYYAYGALDGNDLNKTFHKSWAKIKNSARFELYLEQITHYISTYGTNFQGDIYIPDEVLGVPDLKIKFKVINGYTKDEFIDKSLSMLRSGVALTEGTINDLLTLLVDQLGYSFTGNEGIKNKEALDKMVEDRDLSRFIL